MTSFKGRGRSGGFEKRSVGKRVAKAAAAGGSRSYRGDRPINWYASLVVIVILGIASIVYSRYERLHATATASHTHKTTASAPWFVALSTDICGTVEPPLAASSSPKSNQIVSKGNGLLEIPASVQPKKGGQIILGSFLRSYPSLQVSSTSLRYPGKGTWHNGEHCPSASTSSRRSSNVLAGRSGVVEVASWSSIASSHPVITYRNPSRLALHDGEMITIAFLPKGVSVPKPPASSIASLLKAMSAVAPTGTSTTPTSGSGSTPTVPVRPSTTAPTGVHSSSSPVTSGSSSGSSTTTKTSSSSSSSKS